jgi:hypothetical protein
VFATRKLKALMARGKTGPIDPGFGSMFSLIKVVESSDDLDPQDFQAAGRRMSETIDERFWPA